MVDKWFALQATARLPGTLQHVKALMEHPAFTIKNPNKVRSLIGAFCRGNPAQFHDASGDGYRFLADQIISLDRLNPQIAARLLGVMTQWRRYDVERQALMRGELERIRQQPKLSPDVFEVLEKTLAD